MREKAMAKPAGKCGMRLNETPMKPISANSPSFIEPMQAFPVAKLPEGDWLYEVKFDGYRALAFKDSKNVRLISRNNKPLNYPQLLDSLTLLTVERLSSMVRSSRSMRKADLPFSFFKCTKPPSKACRLFITSSIFSLWMEKTCAWDRFRPSGNSLPTF